MWAIISILTENKPGILFKVTHLFRSRNFNIESISVGVTADPEFSRMTITTVGDEKQIQQIVKQLNKMIDTVEVRRLDDYFSEHAGRPIRFIKCDVEGYELDVFKGAEYILREDRPTLLFECEARHLSNINMADVFSYLTNLGYEGFFFFKNKLLPISHFSTNQHQPELTIEPKRSEYWNNFLFITKNTNDNTL